MDESAERDLPDVPDRFRVAKKPDAQPMLTPDALIGKVQSDVEQVSESFDTERNLFRFEQEVDEVVMPYMAALAGQRERVKAGTLDELERYEPISRVDRKRGGFLWNRRYETTVNLGGKWVNQEDGPTGVITKFSRMDVYEGEQARVGYVPSYELLLRTDDMEGDTLFPKLTVNHFGDSDKTTVRFEWDKKTKYITQRLFAGNPQILEQLSHTEELGDFNSIKYALLFQSHGSGKNYDASLTLVKEDAIFEEERLLQKHYLLLEKNDYEGLRDPKHEELLKKYPFMNDLKKAIDELRSARTREVTYSFDPEKNALVPEAKNTTVNPDQMDTETFKEITQSILSLIPTRLDVQKKENDEEDDREKNQVAILRMALPGEDLAA